MRLQAYRKFIGISVALAAEQNKVSAVTWRFWELCPNPKGKVPSSTNMKRINEWSGGLVRADDFYELPAASSDSAAGPATREAGRSCRGAPVSSDDRTGRQEDPYTSAVRMGQKDFFRAEVSA